MMCNYSFNIQVKSPTILTQVQSNVIASSTWNAPRSTPHVTIQKLCGDCFDSQDGKENNVVKVMQCIGENASDAK